MISKALIAWGERFLFAPTTLQKFISFFLLPMTLLYCSIVYVKYRLAKRRQQKFYTPIISIGNLIMGGSGKTPVTIALAKQYEKSAVVLRGYGRASEGTIIVSRWGDIETDVGTSGDEAMLLAQSLPEAMIIVASDRLEGITLAQKQGAKVIWLDDGYSKHFIKKFDILLEPASKPYMPWCLPAGPYREKLWPGKKALILQEDKDFRREVTVKNATSRMLLVTGISKPWRLDPFLPEGVIEKVYFPDHYSFSQEELEKLMSVHQALSILTTEKDAVKMESFGIKLSILELTMKLDGTITDKIDTYIKES